MSESTNNESIGYWSVIAIGIGGMVGGGIFAVLGLAVKMAGGGTPIAFLLAGIIALITSYSYTKLSLKYPSQGGTVEFLNKAFGGGYFTGSVNVLLWISYIIMLSLYAFAFGSYASNLIHGGQEFWKYIFTSSVIVIFTILNISGAKIVGESEEYIVIIKIVILLFFVAVGLASVKTSNVTPSAWKDPISLFAGGMIIFVAYEGFELIANTADNVKNPKKTLPRAYFSAIGFVIILYILVSLVTVGNLSIDKIVSAKDYALAAAAKPFLGMFGFTLIAIAAMLSTASAINATLYGAAKVSFVIAKDGELPVQLEKKVWRKPIEGLLISAALTLIVANLFDLSGISTMGSAGFLVIFAAVNAANIKLSSETKSKKWISILGVITCTLALISLIIKTIEQSPSNLWLLLILFGLSFLIEGIYRKFRGKDLQPVIPE